MLTDKLALIDEQSAPLFRIMWVYNAEEPSRRSFENNISAFHVGGGLILSVAHNLRVEAQALKSMDDFVYRSEIWPNLNYVQQSLFEQCYFLDPLSNKRHLKVSHPQQLRNISEAYSKIHFDTRWKTLMERKICKPYLIVQFTDSDFYRDPGLTALFDKRLYFHEPALNRHTFLLELEMQEAFYPQDVAVYKLVNTAEELIRRLPSIDMDFELLDDHQPELYCLQSSPGGVLGRLLNKALIEGYIDHHTTFGDKIGGNYILEGTRYLIKGYFRFGSSGAPYVYFDPDSKRFKVNAIQSEASPIQLSINNNKEGNFQYVNAIASPLYSIRERLGELALGQA